MFFILRMQLAARRQRSRSQETGGAHVGVAQRARPMFYVYGPVLWVIMQKISVAKSSLKFCDAFLQFSCWDDHDCPAWLHRLIIKAPPSRQH